jgi:hypothetical protein
MPLSYFEQRVHDGGACYGIALSTLRPGVIEMLESLRTSGFFRTYTDHSIRHCDQMFAILTWLLPDSVRTALTDIECCLLVVAVYLHDLGMLATMSEFGDRQDDEDFVRFQQRYLQGLEASSTLDADHPTLDHFIFEEYIRSTHARRILTWLTADATEPTQAQALRGLLYTTSEPFRHYLGLICQSHHLNNLYDRSSYPVDFRFGNEPTDCANIQFLAICLRLADILHMSRDRTPSLVFRLISPRNPVSAREWAKQLDISGVGLSAVDSTVVAVYAVCRNPRVYFYLKDFIKICDEELSRCRAWLEAAPAAIAPRYFLNVRHVSDGGLQAHGFIAERFELELDQHRVIDLLMGHSLYGDARVAIRELLQNSLDAVRVRWLEEPHLKPAIVVHVNADRTQLEITDNGIGMDLDVIRKHFLKVGDSYYRSADFRRRCPGYTPISQFGIGFLSSFMIADRVTVITRASKPGSATLVLELEDIYDLFAVRETAQYGKDGLSVAEGGTTVILHLRKGVELRDLCEDVQRWLVFLEFPITVKIADDPPIEAWGIRGKTPGEIAADITRRSDDNVTEFFPIMLSREGVEIVILWPGGKLGDVPVLDPAGRYLLPLTQRVRHWYEDDRMHRGPRTTQGLVRKVANGGVFLANDVPGLKIRETLRIHYVVDCRAELRFTPLVSRGGIAVDDACIKILDLFIEGLIGFLEKNISQLLASGVSKYFCSYYAAQAIGLLLSREDIEKNEERVLSAIMAVRHAYKLVFILFKRKDELVLGSWQQHNGQPVVLGRNVYDSLLRSVAFGLVDFPLPKEVIDSLPDNYILSMGAEEVIRPMMLLTTYSPSAVLYHEPSRGVFVRWELDAPTTRFGATALLDFPEELRDVAGLKFSMVSCLSKGHPAIRRLIHFANDIIQRTGESKRAAVEEKCTEVAFELGHMKGHPGLLDDAGELRRHLRDRLARIADTEIDVPDDLVALCLDAKVVRDDLWWHGQ